MAKISQRTIKNAIKYYIWKSTLSSRADGKYKARLENRTRSKIRRYWSKQVKWIITEMEKLPQFQNEKGVKFFYTKEYEKEIKDFLDEMPYNESIVEGIAVNAKASYVKGGRRAFKQFALAQVGMSFTLVNEGAVEYINKLTTLHLSSYRGSITNTTKKRIIKILQNSLQSGLNYTDTAKLIRKQAQAGVFSQARAEMIAVREIGLAYGQGNFKPIKRYQDEYGAIIQKSWITAQDDVVTWQCAENEAMGWIGTDGYFTHTGVQEVAPRSDHPRCRCDTGYREVDLQGKPI